MKIYLLFQYDRLITKSTRVLFGVYSTKQKAQKMAELHGLTEYESEFRIEECTLNQFNEI